MAACDSGHRNVLSSAKIIGPIRAGTRLRVEKALYFNSRAAGRVTDRLRADFFAQLIAPDAISLLISWPDRG